jgi:hypothetical protein
MLLFARRHRALAPLPQPWPPHPNPLPHKVLRKVGWEDWGPFAQHFTGERGGNERNFKICASGFNETQGNNLLSEPID